MNPRCQHEIESKFSPFGFAFCEECVKGVILLPQYLTVCRKIFPSGFMYNPSIFSPNLPTLYSDTLNKLLLYTQSCSSLHSPFN